MHPIRMRKCTAIALSAAVMSATYSSGCKAGTILSPSITNFYIMMENAAEFGAFIGESFVTAPPTTVAQTLTWSGAFNSTGWSLKYGGTYNGDPLSYLLTGVYHLSGTTNPIHDEITWTGSGSVGPLNLSQSGQAVIVDDWTWRDTLIVVAGVVAIVGIGAEVINPELAPISKEAIKVTGQVIKHVATKIYERKALIIVGTAIASAAFSSNTATASETAPGVSSTSAGTITGSPTSAGTVTGSTSVAVPEPGSFMTLGIGLVALAFVRRRLNKPTARRSIV